MPELNQFFSHFQHISVNGNWGSWSSFGECSKKRTRGCDSPVPSGGGIYCYGHAEETSICNNVTCPGKLQKYHMVESKMHMCSQKCIHYKMILNE